MQSKQYTREEDDENSKAFYKPAIKIESENNTVLGILESLNEQIRAIGSEDADSIPIEVIERPPKYLVSAIVSTYNSERFIRGCLEDLEAQTIADRTEIIVIDSCSTQNEKSIVEELQRRFSNIMYVRTEMRESLYAAWNRAIRMAQGKYITNTNTDDKRLPHALEYESRALDQHPEAGLVYADTWGTTVENDVLTPDDTTRYRLYSYIDFTPLNGLTGSNFSPQPMWRKSCHDTIGYFDESYTIAGDYEFFYRLALHFNAIHIKAPLGLYLENPFGIEKSQPGLTMKEFRRLRKKFYSEVSLDQFFPSLSSFHGDLRAQGAAFFELGSNCLYASLCPEYELAEAYYNRALALRGPEPQILHNLAIAQIGSGFIKKSMETLKTAARLLPKSLDLMKALDKYGWSLALLPPGAVNIFRSEHPVIKSARNGLAIDIEDLSDPLKAHPVNTI